MPTSARARTWFTGSGVLGVWLLGLLVLAGGWALQVFVSQPTRPGTGADSALSAADARQLEILRGAIDLPADPALAEVYDALNARHFHGLLPSVPVVWEPRLVEVGQLAGDAYSLEGTFGRLGDRSIILLNPDLAPNPEAILRALSHEMVHVWLHSIGEPSTGHGRAFQIGLKRLASEGAFTGVAATVEEREALGDWLDSESARLDSMSAQARREHDTLQTEAEHLERTLAAMGERGVGPTSSDPSVVAWRNRRDAYNRRVEELQDRKTQHDREVAAFNAAVERYNLMAAYPSGIDDQAAH